MGIGMTLPVYMGAADLCGLRVMRDSGSVVEWSELVTLIPVLQRTHGSMFELWFGLGSYRWIFDEFSYGVSFLLVYCSNQTCRP